jgi:hypothetical protein
MVSYRDRLAVKLHNIPAAIALGLPVFAHSVDTHSLTAAYQAMGHATLRTFTSILLAVLFPAVLGAGRTLLSGMYRTCNLASSSPYLSRYICVSLMNMSCPT